PWQPPVMVPELSSSDRDYGPALSADGLSIIIQSDRDTLGNELYEATRASTSEPFGPPTRLLSLSSMVHDEGPALSSDGLTLYFASNRSAGFHLYVATRSDRGLAFDPPQLVAATATYQVIGPSLSDDGTELFVTVNYPTNDLARITDLDQPTATLQMLTELNSAQTDGFPTISRDGLTLFWEGHGGDDILTAERPDRLSPFGPSRVVSELISTEYDGDPEISKDGRSIWFSSDRQGNTDIFMATRDCE
ncbi:MAG: TolB family protein, partial [Kofleriaceae bacterium]